jgi:hypothetical protein
MTCASRMRRSYASRAHYSALPRYVRTECTRRRLWDCQIQIPAQGRQAQRGLRRARFAYSNACTGRVLVGSGRGITLLCSQRHRSQRGERCTVPERRRRIGGRAGRVQGLVDEVAPQAEEDKGGSAACREEG